MQVSVEQTSELTRKMTVSIPEEVIKPKVDARLASLKNEVKIDGFRPGKIPQSLINKRYGARVRGEIASDMIQSSYYEALKEQDLNPTGMPNIQPVEQEGGLAYTAEFEVYPEISLANISEIEAKRPVVEINDTDFDEMVAKLREHKKEWIEVERAIQDKDRVTLNFSGECEGENFTDGKVEDFHVEIGDKKMIPGFEDELIGLQVSDNKSFEITFPEEYAGNSKLAGKLANFDIEIVAIEESTLPEIDEEFIEEYGIESGDIEDFNKDVKTNMENELKKAVQSELKQSVLDALHTNINVTLPTALVDREIETILQSYTERAKQQNITLESADLPRDAIEEQAKQRIGLGLILGEVIKQNELSVDNDKLRSTIEDLARSYDSPDDVLKWYYEDEERLNDVKQMVLEDQTVEWLTGQIKMIDEPLEFSELMTKYHQQQRG